MKYKRVFPLAGFARKFSCFSMLLSVVSGWRVTLNSLKIVPMYNLSCKCAKLERSISYEIQRDEAVVSGAGLLHSHTASWAGREGKERFLHFGVVV